MSLSEREMIQRSRAGEMKVLADSYGLTRADIKRIQHPNSDDPIFPYTGSPQAQAVMILEERGEEVPEHVFMPAGSESAGRSAMDGAGIEPAGPGQ